MVTFGETPQFFDEKETPSLLQHRHSPSGGTLPPGVAPSPASYAQLHHQPQQKKVPMRIQRQYPPVYRQGSPYSGDLAGGSTGEEEPEEGQERSRPDGEVDMNGDYVIYNYDDADTRETNV